MIKTYHRPQTIEEALTLIEAGARPMGGGISLNAPSEQDFAVVDLQDLALNTLEKKGKWLQIGATVSLEDLLQSAETHPALGAAIKHEATQNLRHVGTIAGTLVASNGRSPLATAMLALDARVTVLPAEQEIDLGDVLNVWETSLEKKLITLIRLPVEVNLSYHYVARSPADLPIVAVAAARWPSGRLRVVVGGWGSTPRVALDAPEPSGVEFAVRNITAEAGDEWATAQYRTDVAITLTNRALEAIQ